MLGTFVRPLMLAALAALPVLGQDPGAVEFFEKKIRPVLATRCYACHSAKSPQVQGGLYLDTREGLRRGGNSGAPIVEGDAAASLLIKALQHSEPTLKMPPGKPLPAEVVANFAEWVRMGAPDPRVGGTVVTSLVPAKAKQFWSFQKPKMPQMPDASIDTFLLAKLREKKLTMSPAADRRTLLRRITFDLTGLPPTIAEMDAFLHDSSPDAYERVVDKLLASPRYGERWARHWFDVARYADTRDRGSRFAYSYTYRDWVIRALNEDMPYDEFVKRQIAADRMPLKDKRDLAALGFITLGRNVPKGEHDMIDDRIDVITRGFLGLTVTCARCHDHKFDPIPTRDYYSFYSIIANSREPIEYPLLDSEDRNVPLVKQYHEGMRKRLAAIEEFKTKRHAELVAEYRTPEWIARYLLAAQQASKMSNTEIEKLSQERDYNLFVLRRWRDFLNQRAKENDSVFAEWRVAVAKGGDLAALAKTYGERLAKGETEELRQVLHGPGTPTNIPLKDFEEIRGPGGDANIVRALEGAVRQWQADTAYLGLPPRAMALEDLEKPVTNHVFVRGNPNNLGIEAPRQFLEVLCDEPKPFSNGSGRLDLANAIATKDNPLTARVIVNRVWAWHFGRGLVATPSDYGLRGDPPSHPELLDYLAVRFMEEGWSLKKLHRWIVLSKAYQQSSEDREEARAIDPENIYLWRANRQRLDFESLRDATLLTSGQLDTTMGGLPYALTAEPTVPRRTVYGYVERGRLPGELAIFDFANPESHSPTRYLTTVPQQALYLMNSPFVAAQARRIMARPEMALAEKGKGRVQMLYRLVLGRNATPEEVELGLQFVAGGVDAAPVVKPTTWQWGMGGVDAAGQVNFTPMRFWDDERWQPASILPQPGLGSPAITAKGGEPGIGPEFAVIRRWTAQQDGTVDIRGEIAHKIPERGYGNGIRARVVHSRSGILRESAVHNGKVDMALQKVAVRQGDTIDFIVDSAGDAENDNFTWVPEVGSSRSADAFAGPAPISLNAWERYAQVLLQTNEFAFVD